MNGMKSRLVMEQDTFGCTVTNRFDQLFDDDADPFDILHEAEREKEKKKKKEELKKGSVGKPAKKEPQKYRKAPTFGKGGTAQITNTAGNRAPYDGQLQNENRVVTEVERGKRRTVFQERRFNVMEPPLDRITDRSFDKFERGNWNRGGSRGGMAYSRFTDGFDQRGKREFERQSGNMQSGVRPDDKREGGGPRNWGSVKDPMKGYGAEPSPVEEGGNTEDPQGAVEVYGENQAAEEGVSVPDVGEMTLDEWKALQEQYRPKAEFNLRRPDNRVPTKAVVIHKSKFFQSKKEQLIEEDEDAYAFRRPANDITSSLDINFGSLSRPSRGGRGGRGGRGRGGSVAPPETMQYEVAHVLAPNPDDMEDFPALA